MSQTTSNQANITANKKPYHTPQLQKFGSVSDLTLTMPRPAPNLGDGGTFFNQYAS